MYGGFFGEYLVSAGVITTEQLDEAMTLQRQSNRVLGQLAVDAGLLRADELADVLKLQHESHRKFGVLAVESGNLTQEQIDQLLTTQESNHLFLGDVLIQSGAISQDSLNEHLMDFEAKLEVDSQRLHEAILGLPDSELVHLALDFFCAYCFRRGFAVKVADIGTGYEGDEEANIFLETYHIKHGRIVHLGPALADEDLFLLSTGRGAIANRDAHQRKVSALKYLDQVLYGLSYAVAHEHEVLPDKVRADAIVTALPDGKTPVTFELLGLSHHASFLYISG